MFTIDEDAYSMLNLYLTKLQEHFSNQEEGSEIVKDIEARIAEIFNFKINDGKQVININDIEELVQILGNVEDITGENMSDNSSTENQGQEESESKKGKKKKNKKLYRDPDSKQLAGICSGLSYYTGISATTWRIIFLVFLFIGQVSIIAYLILWIAVPEAKTTSEKLEMKGDKVNLENIEKTVKEEYENVKSNFRNIKSKKTTDTINNIGNAFMSVISITAKVFGKILGVAFLVVGSIILVALTVGLLSVSAENVYFSNDFISMIWLPGLFEYVTNTGTSWLLSISVLVVLIIPVIVVIYWGILLLFNVKSNKYLGIGTFSIWVLAIIIATLTSLNIAASFSSVDHSTHKESIQCDSTHNYYFTLTPNTDELLVLDEDDIDNIHDLHIFIDQRMIIPGDGQIRHIPEIEFYTSKDSCPELQLLYYARGANKNEAGENLKTIKYNYEVQDSIIYFDPYYYITSEKFRAQFVKVKVFIPEGNTFTIDKSLSGIIDIEDSSEEYDDNEMTEKLIEATKEGFLII